MKTAVDLALLVNYEQARDWAKLLGNEDAADILDEILDEKKEADARLGELAGEQRIEPANGGENEKPEIVESIC